MAYNKMYEKYAHTQKSEVVRTPIMIDGRIKYTVVDRELQGTIHEKHFVRIPPGIGLRLEAINQAERAGAIFAVITCFETRDTYIAPLSLFREKGIHRNYGFGDQIILPLGYWRINGQPPAVEQQTPPTPEPSANAQLSLFGAD